VLPVLRPVSLGRRERTVLRTGSRVCPGARDAERPAGRPSSVLVSLHRAITSVQRVQNANRPARVFSAGGAISRSSSGPWMKPTPWRRPPRSTRAGTCSYPSLPVRFAPKSDAARACPRSRSPLSACRSRPGWGRRR
jgi:hypothetical protein